MSVAAPKDRGYVYFAGVDLDTIKIGFTTNIGSRMTTLSTGSSKKLEVHKSFATTAAAEKLLHDHFAKERIRGEWFNLTADIEELWDDILDYQMLKLGTGEAGNDPDEVFIKPKHVALMLDFLNRPWPQGIFA
jgi:hypothetical protein